MATLLVIDDSKAHRRELRQALVEAGFERVLEAADGLEGLRRLLEEAVDLVICDVEMPGLDGGKLVGMSRAAKDRTVPFLMLTALADPERRARLFLDGAADVVPKPYHPAELVARIRHHLELRRLQAELVEKNRALERLSSTDELTGLWNRRHLERALRIEFMRAARYGTPLAAVLADVDDFKRVNDARGHAAGDRVLCEVGARLQSRLRATDVAGRYGGDEFLLLLGVPVEGAQVAAERWRQDLEERPVRLDDGREVQVTLSLGVARYEPAMETPDVLIARADAALYTAKGRGRNAVVVAGEDEDVR